MISLLAACSAGPEASTGWYVGDAVFKAPGGSAEMGRAPTAIERTVDPEAAQVVERVVQAGDPLFDVVITYDVAEDGTWSGTIDDPSGTMEVEGEFTAGEAWAWTAWTSTATYADGPYVGSYVESEDSVDAERLVARKSVFSPDDHAEADIIEKLDAVDQAMFDAAAAEIVGG